MQTPAAQAKETMSQPPDQLVMRSPSANANDADEASYVAASMPTPIQGSGSANDAYVEMYAMAAAA